MAINLLYPFHLPMTALTPFLLSKSFQLCWQKRDTPEQTVLLHRAQASPCLSSGSASGEKKIQNKTKVTWSDLTRAVKKYFRNSGLF